MNERKTTPRPLPWRVGELAKRTGLTVRALHHYDEIGLLSPSHRSAAGHRLYGQADVSRLQQIQSLRSMGFPLEEIRRLLLDPGVSPQRVLYLQLGRLRERIALENRLVDRLLVLARHFERAESVSAEELCQMIEDMSKMDRYFTADQLAEIRQRGEQLGEGAMHEAGRDWAEIIPAVRAAMDAGTDPSSPEVLALARRWKALVEAFTGGNAGINKALTQMYTHEGPTLERHLGPVPDQAMFEYMGKAFAALKAE